MTGRSPLRRRTVMVAVSLLAAIAVVAAMVRLTGPAPQARNRLAFDFAPPPARQGDAAAVAAGNLRLAGAALLAALVVRLRPGTRLPLDLVLGALAALNAAVAGVALGAYGHQLLLAVAAHAPLELAAFAIAGGAYLAARRGALNRRQLAIAAAACTCLLVTAALVETYVQVGGAP